MIVRGIEVLDSLPDGLNIGGRRGGLQLQGNISEANGNLKVVIKVCQSLDDRCLP